MTQNERTAQIDRQFDVTFGVFDETIEAADSGEASVRSVRATTPSAVIRAAALPEKATTDRAGRSLRVPVRAVDKVRDKARVKDKVAGRAAAAAVWAAARPAARVRTRFLPTFRTAATTTSLRVSCAKQR
jgi:hypothetical protein